MINVNEATTKFDSIIKLTMPVQDDLSLVHYVGFITQFNSIGRGWVVTCTCTCTCVVLAMFSKRNILVPFSSFFLLGLQTGKDLQRYGASAHFRVMQKFDETPMEWSNTRMAPILSTYCIRVWQCNRLHALAKYRIGKILMGFRIILNQVHTLNTSLFLADSC